MTNTGPMVADDAAPGAAGLVLTEGALEFITVPTGTTIRLDGEIVGTTWGPAPPEIASTTMEMSAGRQEKPVAAAAPYFRGCDGMERCAGGV